MKNFLLTNIVISLICISAFGQKNKAYVKVLDTYYYAVTETCVNETTGSISPTVQQEVIVNNIQNDSVMIWIGEQGVELDNHFCRIEASFFEDSTFSLFKIQPVDKNAEYEGTGKFSLDTFVLDYTTKNVETNTITTCHLESIPLIYYDYTFTTPKIWSYFIESNENGKQETILYKIKFENFQTVMTKSLDNGETWEDIGIVTTAGTKIYFQPTGQQSSKLLYDFDLVKGDFFNGKEVFNVDTVNIGIYKKKRFSFADDEWIEGVGSVYKPYFDEQIMGLEESLEINLLCVQYHPERYPYPNSYQYYDNYAHYIWKNSVYNECYYEKTAIKTLDKTLSALSPNPVRNTLNITLPQGEHTVTIYNAAGSPVLKQQAAEPQAQIVVNGLAAGVYFVQVDGGEMLKFVKD